ncbi:beta strand repeat-containing protein [Croceitalea sp. MTPC6]|uniref:beta strand repeat-containing protein n=5 Tax=unclassified Croceitalea TaxID=2632280 RepID=UPI0030D9A052
MKKYLLSVMLGIFAMGLLQSQIKIGNNPQNIDGSSVLELESNSRVLVITRISDAQMNSISPLQGGLVYNTDEGCVFYYDGTTWVNLCEELNTFNVDFEVVGEDLVLTDNNGDSVSVPLSDLGVYTFTSDPVFNPVDNDNTIVITETGDNVNIEVGEITGFNIVDSSINGFLDIQDGSIVNSKLQDDSVDRSKIDANVAGVGISQAPDGSLDVDLSEITGTGTLTSPTSTLTISGDPANSLFNSVGLDVADNAITNAKMADNAIGTAEIINDAVTTDKILDASITNGKLDKPTIPISGFAPAATDVDFGNNRLTGVVDPSSPTDAANQNYVDNAVGGLSTLADGTIYIGDATDTAQELAISGDATMDNAGVLTIEPDAVDTAEIIDAAITDSKLDKANIPLSGFGAATANVDLGTNKLINVTDPTDLQDAATKNYVDNATDALNTLADGTIYIGDATNTAQEIAINGDALVDNTGLLTIQADAVGTTEIIDANVTNAKLDKANIPLSGFGAATANIAMGGFQLNNVAEPTAAQDAATRNYVDNSIATSNALANTNIFVGSATGVATGVALSGDATINNAGVLTIGTDAVGTAEIIDANVTDAKLDKANIPLSGFGAATANITMGGFQLNNVAEPTAAQDAATRNYVDNAVGGVNTLANGTIYIGDATNTAQEIAINGDALVDNTGLLTIQADAVGTTEIIDANVTNAKLDKANIPLSGFGAATANIAMGGFQLNNVAEPTAAQDAATRNYVDNSIATSNALANTNIFVGSATGVATGVALSGDATINNAGVLTIGTDAVGTTEIIDANITDVKLDKTNIPLSGFGAATANIAMGGFQLNNVAEPTAAQDAATRNYVDNAITASNTLTSANILVGNATNIATGVVLSGDATIDNTGLLTIGADAVGTTEIINANVTPAKIAPSATDGQVLTTVAGATVWQDPAEATVTATAGSIFFADGSNGLDENNAQLFWDNSTNRLAIGAATRPLTNKLTVDGTTRTSGLLNSNGTAGTPSYRFSNDTNLDTGMYFPAQDQLAFSAGGQEILRIRESVGNGLEIVATGTLELTDQLIDENGATGNVGDVLTATATGTEWREPAVVAMGKANGANSISVNGATVGGVGGGINTVSLTTARPDDNYIIQLSVVGDNRIYITSQNAGDFTVEIRSNTTNALVIANWHFTILDF